MHGGTGQRHSVSEPKRIVVGVSGASGAIYALRLIDALLAGGHQVHLVVTEYGQRLLHDEMGVTRATWDDLSPHLPMTMGGERGGDGARDRLFVHPFRDAGATIASGSFVHQGMVVIPASSQSLGAIASGAGSNLLVRAAHVTLKERRPLIVCHRESPLSLIDIESMRTITLAGGIICPLNPGYYLKPNGLSDLVDFMVAKVLDLLKVPHELSERWGTTT